MDLGFETIGNATLIVHDRGPLLATDPWIAGSPYFGSWGPSHEIPGEQRAAILAAPFLWFSHGHPDHLNEDSLALLLAARAAGASREATRTILLPDHVGGRVRRDLEALGATVRVLPDRRWVRLSERVRVLCLADDYQDAVLLVDLGGVLVADLNDASDRGWRGFVRRELRRFESSYLLALAGGGDTDMFHFFDESGAQVFPAASSPPGKKLASLARALEPRFVIPFSSMHRYQRTDSVWAARFTARIEDFPRGYDAAPTLLPAFVRVDAKSSAVAEIRPAPAPERLALPVEFGDRWEDLLEKDDVAKLGLYFRSVEHLRKVLRFVRFRVGGRDHTIDLGRRGDRGITFEVPRGSLMAAVEHRVFDDLLIGNFMKTTLHGAWPPTRLYPDFSPWVARLADQGGARRRSEVARYVEAYRRRAPLEHARRALLESLRLAAGQRLRPGSWEHRLGRRAFRWLTGRA